MHSSPVLSLSPSFSNNNHSCAKLAEIAVQQFNQDSEAHDILLASKNEESHMEEEEDDNFDFSFVCTDTNAHSVSADDIFCNGKIRPLFPILNTDMLLGNDETENSTPRSIRLPLSKLFIEERNTWSCSSSEADELDRIQSGTYCVWTEKCKKSSSATSSKRWKLRDLLHRSNSDGKDTFVFLTPKKSTKESSDAVSVHKAHREVKDANQPKSFLPYRQDLVGLFANVNGLSRNLHPF